MDRHFYFVERQNICRSASWSNFKFDCIERRHFKCRRTEGHRITEICKPERDFVPLQYVIMKNTIAKKMRPFLLRCCSLSVLMGIALCPAVAQNVPGEDDYFSVPMGNPLSSGSQSLVDGHTGHATVSIPLYTIQAGDINVPIALSYTTTGIKVQDIAGWTGLGWVLSAGGKITRMVKGKPDEASDGYYNSYNFFSKQTGTSGFNGDGEPDIYTFEFCGRSGYFVLDHDKSFHLIPQQNLTIQRFSYGTSDFYFIITDEAGNRYWFGDDSGKGIEKTKTSRTKPTALSYSFISTWNLTKIESYKGNIIEFTYGAYAYQYTQYLYRKFAGVISEHQGDGPYTVDIPSPPRPDSSYPSYYDYPVYSFSPYTLPPNTEYYRYPPSSYPYHVITKQHIKITTSWQTTIGSYWSGQHEITRVIPQFHPTNETVADSPEEDISSTIEITGSYLTSIKWANGTVSFSSNNQRQDLPNGRKLNRIDISAFDGAYNCFFDFEYSYFSGVASHLCLNSLSLYASGGNRFVADFEYYRDHNLPARNSGAYDQEGLCSGEYSENRARSPRTGNFEYAQANVLTTVRYGTGARTDFTYELNRGLRVKKVTTTDGVTSYTREYKYVKNFQNSSQQQLSSALILGESSFARVESYEKYNNEAIHKDCYITINGVYSQPINRFYEPKGYSIAYSEVAEVFPDGSFVVRKYQNPNDIAYTVKYCPDTGPWTSYTVGDLIPARTSMAYFRGMLIEESMYKPGSIIPVKKIRYSYRQDVSKRNTIQAFYPFTAARRTDGSNYQ